MRKTEAAAEDKATHGIHVSVRQTRLRRKTADQTVSLAGWSLII